MRRRMSAATRACQPLTLARTRRNPDAAQDHLQKQDVHQRPHFRRLRSKVRGRCSLWADCIAPAQAAHDPPPPHSTQHPSLRCGDRQHTSAAPGLQEAPSRPDARFCQQRTTDAERRQDAASTTKKPGQLVTRSCDELDTPKGIRTPVASVKGRCPRPLDDGGEAAAMIAA